MKGQPVDQLVYDYIFPNPKPTDPQNFQGILQRYLILEIRQETQCFYGHVDTQEAKYPGLDYNHPTHRIRLCRWSWHRRLFKAFDGLGLTQGEIARLTKWEGSKWAKERFEMERGIFIHDTAGDGVPDWVEPAESRTPPANADSSVANGPSMFAAAAATAVDDASHMPLAVLYNEDLQDDNHDLNEDDNEDEDEDEDVDVDDNDNDDDEGDDNDDDENDENDDGEDDDDVEDEDEDDEDEDDDGELESIGVELNNRLRAQAARRDAGDTSAVLDEEWELWLKHALETGALARFAEHLRNGTRRDARPDLSAAPAAAAALSVLSDGVLDMVRAGRWDGFPESLQPVLRSTFDAEAGAQQQQQLADQFQLGLELSEEPQQRLPNQLHGEESPDDLEEQNPQQQQPRSSETPRRHVAWSWRLPSELRLPEGAGDAAPAGTSQRTAEASGV